MLIITLPDSSQRSYPSPVSIYDVAADIGPGLASDALAGKIDGILLDSLGGGTFHPCTKISLVDGGLLLLFIIA